MIRITGEMKCTLVALSIEKDLRQWIKNEILTIKNIDDLLNEKLKIQLKHKLHIKDEIIDDNELINVADYGECIDILNEHKKVLTHQSQLIYLEIKDSLISTKQIRDRAAHKSLLASDIDGIDQFIKKIKKYSGLFLTVFAEIENWKDNNSIEIDFDREELEKGEEIQNNLPENEFDGLGFIRRDKLEKRLDQTIKKNSVIVVTGDAGIGKTALLLHKCHQYKTQIGMYDEIKWFTFKTQTFSNNEVRELNKTLKYKSFIESFTDKKKEENHTQILLEYIQKNKCLLILDNLESVLDQNILNFIEGSHDIDHESKILITSREPIDSGVSIKVLKFDDQSAEFLFRKYSNYLDLEMLKKKNSTEIKKLTNSRENNPLGIKLSLEDIYNGTSIQDAFKPNKKFLNYSYKNLFLKLNDFSKEILEILFYLEGEFTLTNICTYSGIDPENIENSLADLDKKRFLIRDSKSSGTEYYSLRPIIKKFLEENNFFNDLMLKEKILNKYEKIKTTKSEYKINSEKPNRIRHDFDSFYKRKDSDDEAINELLRINKYIHGRKFRINNAYKAADDSNKDLILNEIHSDDQKIINTLNFLKKKHPNYCEIYRVEGVFYGHTGSVEKMKNSFERAIELAPTYPNPCAFYIERLRANSQFEYSIEVGIKFMKQFPENIEIKYQLLQSKFFNRDFDNLTEELATQIGLSVNEYHGIDFKFARKLVKISLEYHRRYAEYLIIQGSKNDFEEAFNQIVKLMERYTEFEKIELIDAITTNSVIKKSFGEIEGLRGYFEGSKKGEIILGIRDVFNEKNKKYTHNIKYGERDTIKNKFTDIQSSPKKTYKRGDITEGVYAGSQGLTNEKIGGFINLIDGVYVDYDGITKNRIFIHSSNGTNSIPFGAKLSFELNDHEGVNRKSLVAIKPKIL